MKAKFLLAPLALLVGSRVCFSMSPQERKDYRDKLMAIIPPEQSFSDWVTKTDALPPDFDTLPKHNDIPDPLIFLDGKTVKTPADWTARRAEIKAAFEKYMIGSIPPKPTASKVEVTAETQGQGFFTRTVKITYGPEDKGSMDVTVTIPAGNGPFPVLIGGGADTLIRRGYISCSFPSSVDTVTAIPGMFPNNDFGTMGQVAWSSQLVVDYLYTMPQVDKQKIAVTGYSRGGKMALTVAAVETRINAVIAGSAGVGGVTPWRLSGERGMGEGIESTTRMFPLWYAKQFRWFTGQEERLPIDNNLLVALVAPRAVLMQYGLNDEVSNTGQAEQTYKSAYKAFNLLGAPNAIGILRNAGFHSTGMNMDVALDWLDIQFGRSTAVWHNDFLFPWKYETWKKAAEAVDVSKFPKKGIDDLTNGGAIKTKEDWEKQADAIKKNVNWLLGDEPPVYSSPRGGRGGFGGRGGLAARGGPGRGPAGPDPGQIKPDVPGWVRQRASIEFGWSNEMSAGVAMRSINFGQGLKGDLYYPESTAEGTKLPTVIWLHGYSYPLGYMWVYRRDMHPILALAKQGFAVLAFDQTGFGSRMEEAAPFYTRYPKWSRLGRMVEDVHAAVDKLATDAIVDPNKISLFGYSMGGIVALHAAALDSRISSVAAICAFTPMRTDTSDKGTGGIARYYDEIGLIPKLGYFQGEEARIPYDYHELIATIAPRPVVILNPQLNRDATAADVHAAVDQAKKIYGLYGAADNLQLLEPWDFARLNGAEQDQIIAWMKDKAK